MRGLHPRAILVTRPTPYEELLGRHATRDQAAFFLAHQGLTLEPLEQQHQQFTQAKRLVLQAIPGDWRRSEISRRDLDRFLFTPDDVLIVLGQDGLVANTAKYLEQQLVLGVNPDPERIAGVLTPLPPEAVADLLVTAARGRGQVERRTMVAAQLDDGQQLVALNEIFVGHRSHQSARYHLEWAGREESHSSSGFIVTTGTGATGWAKSIHHDRHSNLQLPQPTEDLLAFFVREAWPSLDTQAELVEGTVGPAEQLRAVSQMAEAGVIFGDGLESDCLEFSFGRQVQLRLAANKLHLLRG